MTVSVDLDGTPTRCSTSLPALQVPTSTVAGVVKIWSPATSQLVSVWQSMRVRLTPEGSDIRSALSTTPALLMVTKSMPTALLGRPSATQPVGFGQLIELTPSVPASAETRPGRPSRTASMSPTPLLL